MQHPKVSYPFLRILTLLLALLGSVVYCFLIYVGVHAWSDTAEANNLGFWGRVGTFLTEVIFSSGLPPIMITIYFFLRCTQPAEWLAGLGWLCLFVFTQYVAVIFLAHASAVIYAPIMVVDLVAAIAVISIWERRRPKVAA